MQVKVAKTYTIELSEQEAQVLYDAIGRTTQVELQNIGMSVSQTEFVDRIYNALGVQLRG